MIRILNNIYTVAKVNILVIAFCLLWMSISYAQGPTPSKTLWIDCSHDKLTSWQCTFNFDELMGRKTPLYEDTATTSSIVQLLQDVFLTATMFISVLCGIWLVYAWYLYIMWWNDVKKTDQANKAFRYSLIWLLITIFSVVIVRAIQYIASWKFWWTRFL